jgi:hypothetical protein
MPYAVQDLCFAIQGGDNWNVHFDRDGSGSQGSKATTVTAEGKKNDLLGSTFYTKNTSFYQDRLGTNIGKPHQKDCFDRGWILTLRPETNPLAGNHYYIVTSCRQ